MLKNMEVRQIILTLITSVAIWGGSTLLASATERASTQARIDAHDRELVRLRDAVDRISLVLERQTAISETYGAALRDLTTELRAAREEHAK